MYVFKICPKCNSYNKILLVLYLWHASRITETNNAIFDLKYLHINYAKHQIDFYFSHIAWKSLNVSKKKEKQPKLNKLFRGATSICAII